MATYATQVATNTGTTPTYNAAAGGGDVLTGHDDTTIITVVNADASAHTVTFTPTTGFKGEAITARTVNVPNGQQRAIALSTAVFSDTIGISWSATTGMTWKAMKRSG